MNSTLRIFTVVFFIFYPVIDGTSQPTTTSDLPGKGDSVTFTRGREAGLDGLAGSNDLYFPGKIEFDSLQFPGMFSFSEALQGRIGGLDVITGTGLPGSSAQVLFHGISINSERQPLVVIDGIPQVNTESIFNQYNDHSHDLQSQIPVALQDIESVEILTGATGTVLYGSDAVNGVILVKTKIPGPGKIHVNYNYDHGWHLKPKFPELLSGEEFIMEQLETWHNAYGVFDIPPEISMNRDNPDYYNYSANTDWVDAVTRAGKSDHHYLNIYGGTKKTGISFSNDFINQEGTLINTGYKRNISRTRINHAFSGKLAVTLQASYAVNKYRDNVIPEGKDDPVLDILKMAMIQSPNMSIYRYDPEGNLTGDYFTPLTSYIGYSNIFYNPVAVSETGYAKKNLWSLDTRGNVRYCPYEWLEFDELFSYSNTSEESENYLPSKAIGYENLIQDYTGMEKLISRYLRNESGLHLNFPVGSSENTEFGANFTWIYDQLSFSTDFYRSDYIFILNIPGQKRNAAVSDIHFNFRDRYLFNAASRIENQDVQNRNNTWNKHWMTSAAWHLSKEAFMQNIGFLDDGMFKAVFGKYSYTPGIVYTPNFFLAGKVDSYSGDLELDVKLFQNRLHLSGLLYLYSMNTKQLIYGITSESGMKNQGWSVSTSLDIIRGKNWHWNVYGNITNSRYTVTKIPKNTPLSGGAISNGSYITTVSENESPGSIYGFIYDGIYYNNDDLYARDKNGDLLYDENGQPFPVTFVGIFHFGIGDPIYRDLNHDGEIDRMDLTLLGNSYPRYYGGLGSSVGYKNFSLSLAFHYRLGYEVVNDVALSAEAMYSKYNKSKTVLDRWRTPGDETAIIPRAYLNHPANNLGSNLYVEPGDFLTLDYISFGYSFGEKLCKRLYLNTLSVYVSAQRLFTLTGYSGSNLEIERNTCDPFWIARDNIRLPAPKIISMSVRVGI